jgi:hypothetical protein
MERKIDRVDGAFDPRRLNIRRHLVHDDFWICLDAVPLWRTIEDLDVMDIFLYDPTAYRKQGVNEPYTLFCVDSHGDIYTYGHWGTLREALMWLDNPHPLY